jgi:hypothetical protein
MSPPDIADAVDPRDAETEAMEAEAEAEAEAGVEVGGRWC